MVPVGHFSHLVLLAKHEPQEQANSENFFEMEMKRVMKGAKAEETKYLSANEMRSVKWGVEYWWGPEAPSLNAFKGVGRLISALLPSTLGSLHP